ncbi:MAG: Carotenoid biosynthesis protein, partial [uncultured Thermomicrobiales bacterium]
EAACHPRLRTPRPTAAAAGRAAPDRPPRGARLWPGRDADRGPEHPLVGRRPAGVGRLQLRHEVRRLDPHHPRRRRRLRLGRPRARTPQNRHVLRDLGPALPRLGADRHRHRLAVRQLRLHELPRLQGARPRPLLDPALLVLRRLCLLPDRRPDRRQPGPAQPHRLGAGVGGLVSDRLGPGAGPRDGPRDVADQVLGVGRNRAVLRDAGPELRRLDRDRAPVHGDQPGALAARSGRARGPRLGLVPADGLRREHGLRDDPQRQRRPLGADPARGGARHRAFAPSLAGSPALGGRGAGGERGRLDPLAEPV